MTLRTPICGATPRPSTQEQSQRSNNALAISPHTQFSLNLALVVSSGIKVTASVKMTTAKPLVVPALKRHTATVIFAHGLGDR